jgi:hypothetical protein
VDGSLTKRGRPPRPLPPAPHNPQNRLSQLERPVPITCALLGINIAAHYMPEIFLLLNINLLEIGAICLQPARIVKLMMPPTATGGGVASAFRGWDEWAASFMSFGAAPSPAMAGSAAARWQEAASRVWLSAIVHGDDLHLYYNMMSLLYKGVSLEMAQGSAVRARVFSQWW